MNSHPSPLLGQEYPRLLLEPGDDPLHSGLEVLHSDACAGVPGGDQGGLVTNIRDLSSGEAVSERREILGEILSLFIFCLDSRKMNFEYFCPTSDVRKRNLNVSVKSSRSKESWVKCIKSVSGAENNDLKISL